MSKARKRLREERYRLNPEKALQEAELFLKARLPEATYKSFVLEPIKEPIHENQWSVVFDDISEASGGRVPRGAIVLVNDETSEASFFPML